MSRRPDTDTCEGMSNRELIDDGAASVLQGNEQQQRDRAAGVKALFSMLVTTTSGHAKELVKQGPQLERQERHDCACNLSSSPLPSPPLHPPTHIATFESIVQSVTFGSTRNPNKAFPCSRSLDSRNSPMCTERIAFRSPSRPCNSASASTQARRPETPTTVLLLYPCPWRHDVREAHSS